MDAPLEELGYFLKILLLMICGWVLLPPVVLSKLSKSSLSKREIPVFNACLLHITTLPALILWYWLLMYPPVTQPLMLGLAVLATTLIYQPFLLAKQLATDLRRSFLIWFLSGASPCFVVVAYYFFFPAP